jgi:hypothetical protein
LFQNNLHLHLHYQYLQFLLLQVLLDNQLDRHHLLLH